MMPKLMLIRILQTSCKQCARVSEDSGLYTWNSGLMVRRPSKRPTGIVHSRPAPSASSLGSTKQSVQASRSSTTSSSGSDQREGGWHAARTDRERRGRSRPCALSPQRTRPGSGWRTRSAGMTVRAATTSAGTSGSSWYRNVRCYTGGLADWEDAGYPVEGTSVGSTAVHRWPHGHSPRGLELDGGCPHCDNGWSGYGWPPQEPRTTAAWAVVNDRRQVVALRWFGGQRTRTSWPIAWAAWTWGRPAAALKELQVLAGNPSRLSSTWAE